MADKWKEVSVGDAAVWDRIKPIEGELIKVRSDVGPNGSMMYTLRTKAGDVNLWGSTVLDTKFEDLSEGTMVRIEPLGKTKSEKTGREYQDFKVLYLEGSALDKPDEPALSDEDMPEEFLEQ